MAQHKVVITDFGSPDNDFELAVLNASGLDYNLVRLNLLTADLLIPHINDADALIGRARGGDLDVRGIGEGFEDWRHLRAHRGIALEEERGLIEELLDRFG